MARRLPDDPAPRTVVERTYLHRHPPWMTMRRDHFRLPNGREIPDYFIQEFPPWVNVVAVTRDQQLVMIRQYRPGLEAVHYELPAGATEPDEADSGDHEAAARRELLEETGYGGGRWSLLMTLSANPALQNNLNYTYLAEDVEPVGEPDPDATEDLRVHLVPLDEAAALIEAESMIQALHTAPLLKYLLSRTTK